MAIAAHSGQREANGSLTFPFRNLRFPSLSTCAFPLALALSVSRPESPAEEETMNDLQTWWQNASPETQVALQFGAVVLGALVGGQLVGKIVARPLAARNFDAVLRLPSASPPDVESERGFTPSFVAGLLVRLTVWASAAWWLAQKHGRPDLAHTLGLVINRTWAIAAILVA